MCVLLLFMWKIGWGYTHDRRADKNPYPHDRRADKDSYRHDRRVYSLSQIIYFKKCLIH